MHFRALHIKAIHQSIEKAPSRKAESFSHYFVIFSSSYNIANGNIRTHKTLSNSSPPRISSQRYHRELAPRLKAR